MEIGEPDFSHPAPIVAAGMAALQNGRTFYTPALGIPELRQAIAHFLSAALWRGRAGAAHCGDAGRVWRAATGAGGAGESGRAGVIARPPPTHATGIW